MTKRLCKRLLSTALVLVFAFTTFCFADLGQVASASADAQPVVNELAPEITFYAPEAIYLDPADWDASSGYGFKYFVDSTVSGAPNASAAQTSGTVYFSISQTCSSISLVWPSGTSATVSESGSGSTRTWTITGGSTNTRRGAVTLTVNYTLASGGTYSVSRNIYMYMPRRNATVGVGGAYQYQTFIGNEPVTSATVLLAGLHKVGGGYRSMWTGTANAQNDTSLLIGMPSTQPSGDQGYWPSGSEYEAQYFYTNTGYSAAEGDGYDTNWNSVSNNGGGAKWCGRDRAGNTDKVFNSGVSGQITVDKSRHAALDTVPFLQGGWFIHYNAYSGESAAANYVSTSGNLRVGPQDASFRAEQGVSHPSYGSVPYHLTGTTPSSTTDYTMQGYFVYRRASASSTHLYINYTLTVTIVDKGGLRAKVNEAISKGYRADQLAVSNWSSNVAVLNTRLLEATTVLGNPEAAATEISTALSNLDTALNACVTMAESNAPATINSDVVNMRGATFYVPETIYLRANDRKTGEYIYGLTTTGAPDDHGSALSNAAIANGGLVYWSLPGATAVTITAKLSANAYNNVSAMTSYSVNDGIASMTVGGTARSGSACGSTGWSANTSGATTTLNGMLTAITLTSAVPEGAFKFIEWTATYSYNGAKYQQVAYTAVYAPLATTNSTAALQMFQLLKATAEKNREILNFAVWATGFHRLESYAGSDGGFDATGSYAFPPLTVNTLIAKSADSESPTNSDTLDGCYVAGSGYAGYWWRDGGSDSGVRRDKVLPWQPVLNVDTSRFSNLGSIPNFMVGLDIFENWGGDSNGMNTWSMGWSDSQSAGQTRLTNLVSTVTSSGSNSARQSGRVFQSNASAFSSVGIPSSSVTLWLQGYGTSRSNGDEVQSNAMIPLRVVPGSKSACRSACWNFVKNTQLPINWYTTEEQNAYKLNIVKQFMPLEVPALTAGTFEAPEPSQYNRVGGVITVRHLTTASGNTAIDTQEINDYKYGDDIYTYYNPIVGYTYTSRTGTWTDLGTVQNVTKDGRTWFMIKNACQWNGLNPVPSAGNKTVAFYYTPKQYNVTYDFGASENVTWNGSPVTQPAVTYQNSATFDASFTLESAPERAGYTFIGWQSNADSASIIYPAEYVFSQWKFDGNTTFTAVWEEIAHTHSFTSSVTLAPTCTEAGVRTYVCACGETYTESVAALGHAYAAAEVIEPTCTDDGYTVYTCSRCGNSYTDDFVDARGHAWDEGVVTMAPNCKDEGELLFTCSACGTTYAEPIAADPDAHCWGEWVVTREATVSAEGEETRICSLCGAAETRSIPKLNENPVFVLSGASARQGEMVNVTVSVRNNPGIVSTILRLSYDPQVLTLIDVSNGDVFDNSVFQSGGDPTAIPYGVSWINALGDDNTQNGTLVTYTFAVDEDAPVGETAVTLTYDAGSTFNKQLSLVDFDVECAAWEIIARFAGDSNGDDTIDLRDVAEIIRAIVGGWGVSVIDVNADVNGDGKVDLRDAVLIQRYLVGGWNIVLQ